MQLKCKIKLTSCQVTRRARLRRTVQEIAPAGRFQGVQPSALLANFDLAQHFRSIWDDMGRLIDPLCDPPAAVSPYKTRCFLHFEGLEM
jgi:hypothetical protein